MKEYSNWKRFLVALIPFAVVIPKTGKIIWSSHYNLQKSNLKIPVLFWLNRIPTFISIFAFFAYFLIFAMMVLWVIKLLILENGPK